MILLVEMIVAEGGVVTMQWHHHLDFNNQGKIWFFGQPFPSGNVWICFSRVNQLCSLGFQVDYEDHYKKTFCISG